MLQCVGDSPLIMVEQIDLELEAPHPLRPVGSPRPDAGKGGTHHLELAGQRTKKMPHASALAPYRFSGGQRLVDIVLELGIHRTPSLFVPVDHEH